MDRNDVDNAAQRRPDGWLDTRGGATVVIMAIEDEEEGRLWDEIAGLTEDAR